MSVRLSRHFENFTPALKTVVSRRKRGVYETNRRPLEPSVRDDRGRLVRSIGKAQTFLTEAQVDQIIDLYKGGMSMNRIAQKYRAHRRTIAAHLTRRSVSLREQRSLDPSDTPEAVRLYEDGMPLLEVGRRFGVSQHAARTAIAGAGATIRPKGRIPRA
ncbi:hypothetical protein AB3K78_06810 [Leucobacter sp. HNU]|uniref:hypothetical protein n=1 Tax=Leucobacter sp. HNU TaxID=3236805 RepID=UPI003A7F86EF